MYFFFAVSVTMHFFLGPQWHQRRKILTPAFHFNVLRRFVVIFGEHCEKFAEKLHQECTKDKTNIMPLISGLTLDLICGKIKNRLTGNCSIQFYYCE